MTTDGKLHALYFELGDHQKRAGELAKAADTFALALYYARRTSSRELVQRCREEVAICNPSHIVCREASAPLFFAQLLMRHPPEEAEKELQEIKQRPAPKLSGSNASMADDLFQYAKVDPSCGIFEFPPTQGTKQPIDAPATWLTAIEEEALQRPEPLPEPLPELQALKRKTTDYKADAVEAHHVYPYADRSAEWQGMPSKTVDDYLFADTPPPRRDSLASDAQNGWATTLVQSGAVASIALGIAAIGFFSFELYQSRDRLDPASVVRRFNAAMASLTEARDDESTIPMEGSTVTSESDTEILSSPIPQIGRHQTSPFHGTKR